MLERFNKECPGSTN